MVQSIRILSKKVSFFIVAALLMNLTPHIYAQSLWQRTRAGLAKGAKAVGSAVQELNIPGKVKEVAQSTASKITDSLAEKLNSFKNLAPKVIIPKLLENVEKLGNNIGTISSCMFKGTCSNQERAAFIALSITILALTAALIGLTIGVAATSKEVDEQVAKVSEEVKGWSPKAIFTRLQNTAAQFKQNLLNMQTCLLQRKCTSTQKKILYATAGTIAALAAIAVGIGIGSYIYAQQKEKERQAAAGVEEEKPVETGPILEEMAGYTDALPSWKTRFMQQVSKVIQPVKGAQQTLKNAYTKVQQQIKAGAIKTKEKAAELFNELVTKAKSIDELIRETLNVHVAEAMSQFDQLKNKFAAFKQALDQSFTGQMVRLGEQFKDLADYGIALSQNVDAANKALTELGVKDIFLAKWRSKRKLEAARQKALQRQKELEQEQTQLDQERDAFYAEPISGKTAEEVEPTGTKPAKKPGVIKRIRGKITGPKKTTDESEIIQQKLGEFEARNQKLRQEKEKMEQELATLENMMRVHETINMKFIDQIYPTVVGKLKAIDLSPIGDVVNKVFVNSLVAALAFAGDIHKFAGNIGLIVAQDNIQKGIQDITKGVSGLGIFAQQALSVQPIVTAPDTISTKAFIKALFDAVTDIRLIVSLAQEAKNGIKIAWNLRKQVDPVEKAIKKLNEEIGDFKSQVLDTFKKTIAQEPLKNIPRAPVILLKALGDAIRDLKISFGNVLEESSVFINAALNIGPGIFELANKFNEVFGSATKSELLNPEFMRIVGEAMSQTIPNINECVKSLMKNVQEDMPEEEPETTIAAS